MGYELDDRVSILERGKRDFSSAWRPERLWDPPSVLFIGYRGLSGRIVKLIIHFRLVPR
jgi:hypothetical protein